MSRSFVAAIAWTGVILFSPQHALAHHSYAMFDGDHLVVLRGTMLSFTFMNPHSWISVIVPPGTDVADGRWDVEATSPVALTRLGIHGDTFKAGDKLTVGIRALRDGRHGGSLVFIVDGAGQVYGANPQDFGLKTVDLTPH